MARAPHQSKVQGSGTGGGGGSPGPQGDPGAPGAAGPPGLPGEEGEPGLPIPGPPGTSGADGAAGAPGTQGPPGQPGEDGETIIGPPGLPGAAGQAGADGAAGAMGPPGLPGEEGEPGPLGPPGTPGPAGADGATGSSGPAGSPGPPGLDGDDAPLIVIPGPQGATGAPGGGSSVTSVEKNLGSTPVWRGKVTVTDATVTTASKLNVWQAPGPYTGKGSRGDEAAMDNLKLVAIPGAGQFDIYWSAVEGYSTGPRLYGREGNYIPVGVTYATQPGRANVDKTMSVRGKVKGNFKFFYTVGA